MVEFKTADLLKETGVIVQQCNCCTVKAHGLAQSIKEAFPYADIYSQRSSKSPNFCKDRPDAGTCVISKSEDPTKPIVASLLAQIGPGKCFQWAKVYKFDPESDSPKARLRYFQSALEELSTICRDEKYQTISFPFRIGCGLAGGKWSDYLLAIEDFEMGVRDLGTKVYICKME
jgi:hypothetical protein